jgi:hypothetical protein
MKRFLALWLLLLLVVAISYDDADTFCVIFPQNGRDIFGVTQRSFVIFRTEEIDLIPAVQFEGNARDFGILVPVPAVPKLSTVGSQIFSEASFLTQPLVRRTGEGCGCDSNDDFSTAPLRNFDARLENANLAEDGVTVIYERQVGAFLAAVLQATNAGDLTRWLNQNGYHYNPADSAVLGEYVARDWYFVAMKLDTTQAPPVIDQWWSAFTSPARITFAHSGNAITYPLKISALSTKDRSEVLVYTIGPDPMRFPGAKVEYANFISEAEAEAIASRYTTLAAFLPPDVFLTKLRRTFTKAEMSQDMTITPTNDRSEFREIRYADAGIRGLALLLALFLAVRRWRNMVDSSV